MSFSSYFHVARRSVSNLLSNGFGESLEQLIRSYVQQRGHGPLNWNLDGAMPPSNSPNENQEQERNTETRQFQGPVNRPGLVIPPPPLPPRQPLWHRELRHNNWSSRHRVHHADSVCYLIIYCLAPLCSEEKNCILVHECYE